MILTLACAALCVVAAAAPQRVLRVAVAGAEGASYRWIEAIPLPAGSPRLFRPVSDAATKVDVGVPLGPTLVCAGAGVDDRVATVCRTIDQSAPTAVLRLELGTPVTGTVRVGTLPAVGASVSVVLAGLQSKTPFSLPLYGNAGALRRRVSVSADGSFRVPRLAPGKYRIEIRERAGRLTVVDDFEVPPWRPKVRRSDPDPIVDLGRILLPDGLALPVRVEDGLGRPVAAAAVGVLQGHSPTDNRFFEATTDTEGKVLIEGLDDALPTDVTCERDAIVQHQSFTSLPADVVCTLPVPGSLDGTVATADGMPLAGASIAIEGTALRATSDALGRFRVESVPTGPNVVRILASGFKIARVNTEVYSGQPTKMAEVTLSAAEVRRGRVVDRATRKPIAGASVVSMVPLGAVSTSTADDGVFEVDVDDEEPFELHVAAAGFAPTRVHFAPAVQSTDPQQIELVRPGWILVQVNDPESNAPCLACVVQIQGAVAPQQLTTAADGQATSEPLSPGTYIVSLENIRTEGSAVTVSGGDNSRVAEVGELRTTRVSFGEGARPLVVVFRPAPPADWVLVATGRRSAVTARLQTDGTYVIHRRLDEAIRLDLSDGAGTVVAQDELPEHDARDSISLPLSVTRVEGTVMTRSGTTPLVNRRVELASALDRRIIGQAVTDAHGHFEIPYVRPGTYLPLVEHLPVGRPVDVPIEGNIDLGALPAPEPHH